MYSGPMNYSNSSSLTTQAISDEDLSLLQNLNVAYAILQILFMPGIIFGNILVIVSILVFKRLRHHTNFMLINLAAAGLLVGVFACPLNAAAFVESKVILGNRIGCLLSLTSTIVSCSASVLSIFVIIIDRCIAVCYPGTHFKYSRLRTVVIVLTILWVFTIVMSSLPWLGWDTFDERKQCDPYTGLPATFVQWVVFSILGVCLFGSLILYAKIWFVVRLYRNRVSDCDHYFPTPINQLRKDIQDTQITAFMFLIFVLFWAPFFVMIPIRLIENCPEIVQVIMNGSLVLAFSNSLVNPIVYALTRKNFRTAYSLILTTPFTHYSTLRHCEIKDVVNTKIHRKTTASSFHGEL